MTRKNRHDGFHNAILLVKKYEEAVLQNESLFFSKSELLMMIEYYTLHNKYEEAIVVADLGIELYFFSDEFHVEKASLYLSLGLVDDALDSYETASILSPSDFEITLSKLDAYLLKSMHKEAIDMLNSFLKYADEEQTIAIYHELADIYQLLNAEVKVIDYLEKILLLEPDNEEALNQMWLYLDTPKCRERCLKFHLDLLEVHPYTMLAWYNLSYLYELSFDYEKALEALEFAIAIDETYMNSYIASASINKLIKEYDTAISLFEEAIEKFNVHYGVYFQLVELYRLTFKYDKAIAILETVLEIYNDDKEASKILGCVYLDIEEPAKALPFFKKALRKDANNDDLKFGLADAYKGIGEYETALPLYLDLLEKYPKIERLYRNIASILFDQGCVTDAIDMIDLAIQNTDEDGTNLYYIKAAYLYDLGKRNQMFDALIHALTLDEFRFWRIMLSIAPMMEHDAEVMALIESFK